MSTFATPPPTSEHQGVWKSFLALGLLLLVLGLAGLTVAGLMELTSLLILSPLLLASSFVQFLIAFFAEKGKETRLHLVAAGFEALLGFFIMANPLHRVVGLVALIGVFLVVIGLARLARALMTEFPGRGWIVLAGVVSVVLGICVWTGWPDPRLGFVALCIAVDFICHGASWSALALMQRNPGPKPVG
jgi:uncharacterized membrane protein HdeD (DUF308 family)